MSKLLITAVLTILFLFGCSNDSNNPSQEQNEVLPTGYYKFDVKTKFSDKLQSTGAKSGVSSYLKKSGWADIKETDEDYSVWIINLVRTPRTNGTVTVDFNLELHTPAYFTDGDLIPGCIKHFRIQYKPDEDVDIVSKPLTPEAVINGINSVVDSLSNTALKDIPEVNTWLSTSSGITDLLSIILTFIDTGSTKENQVEAYYAGLYCYSQIKEWMLTIEKK